MRKTILAGMFAAAAAAAAFTVSSEARADAPVHSGDVLRPGENMIYPEVGWPDLAFGFQHGVSEKVDIGVRASFIYGWEYTTYTALGFGIRVPIRITPLKTQRVSLQIQIAPGLKFDSFGSCGQTDPLTGACIGYASYNGAFTEALHFGLWLYAALEVGIHITREATISPGVEIPTFINFTNGSYGTIPLLFGAAFQYNINDQMSVGGSLKLGPSIFAGGEYGGCGAVGGFGVVVSCGAYTPLGLIANAFFGYRL
jgi:hypothetical protein